MNETLAALLKDAALLNWNDNGRFSPYQQRAWERIIAAPRDLAIQALEETRASLIQEAREDKRSFCPADLAWELSLEK